MLKSKVAVQVISSGMLPEDTLMLGEAQVKQWKIPQGQHILVKFGAFRQHVKVIPVAKYDGMRISQSLARQMGLTNGTSIRLQYKASTATLVFGPLIGVLISRDYPHMPDKPFGSITMFCRELVEACTAQGAYVYFSHLIRSAQVSTTLMAGSIPTAGGSSRCPFLTSLITVLPHENWRTDPAYNIS